MWVTHPIYNNYMANKNGEIRHVSSKKNRALRCDKDGYLRFNICFKGRCLTVKAHSFVLECFVCNDSEMETVNHIDGNKSNNKLCNLEWMSLKDNVSDSYNRAHNKCHPVVVNGVAFRSKRQAEKVTGISRFTI